MAKSNYIKEKKKRMNNSLKSPFDERRQFSSSWLVPSPGFAQQWTQAARAGNAHLKW